MSLNTIRDLRHLFSMPVTYKIGRNESNVIFLLYIREKLSCFQYKLFCNKDLFPIICLNYDTPVCLSVKVFFFQKLEC